MVEIGKILNEQNKMDKGKVQILGVRRSKTLKTRYGQITKVP
jgi:hypothetical protein